MIHKQGMDILLPAGMYFVLYIYNYVQLLIVQSAYTSRTVVHYINHKHPLIELLSACYVTAT